MNKELEENFKELDSLFTEIEKNLPENEYVHDLFNEASLSLGALVMYLEARSNHS